MVIEQPTDESFKSGFVALAGRPNVGKSTLLNQIIGRKVTIVSDKVQTTRNQIRGVHTTKISQIVFVDTPGIGKPRSALGRRLNHSAESAWKDVDLVCLLIDGKSGFGRGDEFLAKGLKPEKSILVVNKIDDVGREQIARQLGAASPLDFSSYFPISAFTGSGVPQLVEHLAERLPTGPLWYPDDMVTDAPEAFWVAELVREQLLRVTRDELPHSIATRVTEWEWPRVKVEILVERESQKGIVIGTQGSVLKQVGSAARRQLPKGIYLELIVTVDSNWHNRPAEVERLGY